MNTEKPIEKLTPEQEKNIQQCKEEWLRISSSCEPADRQTTERVIREMYKEIDEPEPPEFIWCDGPFDGYKKRVKAMKENYIKQGKELTKEKEEEIKEICLKWPFRGQHDSAEPLYYLWSHHAIRPIHSEETLQKLTWWLDLAKSCGWWAADKGKVFVCERTLKQVRDNENWFHCEDGPAVLYRDGLELYAWHGVRVPKWVIMEPEKITTEVINNEAKAEVRKAMTEVQTKWKGKSSP